MKCKEFESLKDRYLDGTIEEKKRELFEQHYFLCDSCYTSLRISESLYGKKVHIVTGEKRNYSMVFRPSLLLVSLLLVVFSTLFYIDLNNRSERIKKISGFTPPLYIKGENRGDNSPSGFNEGMDYYTEGDYKRSYEVISAIKPGNPQVWFFGGILGLINGENKNALSFFNKIISKMDPSYYDEAVFYRGICYLRMNRKGDALKEFKILETMFTPYRTRAIEIIDRINKL